MLTNETTDNSDGEIIDDRGFKLSVLLFNPDGRVLKLRKSAIQELVIEDQLLDIASHGYVTISSPEDCFERASKMPTKSQDAEIIPYRYRGDSRDFISITFEPTFDIDVIDPTKLNKSLYTIKHTYVIYNIEDLPSEAKTTKSKRLYFRDVSVQYLKERNLMWSTGYAGVRAGTILSKRPLSQQSNGERSTLTGIAIKDLITQALNAQPASFSQGWDNGIDEIFFSLPAHWSAMDGIQYLLSGHVSSDATNNMPCILKLDRTTNKWMLQPLSKYYQAAYDTQKNTAGPYSIERFLFSTEAGAKEVNQTGLTDPRFYKGQKSTLFNPHFQDISLIDNYMFHHMTGDDIQNILTSHPLNVIDSFNKRFSLFQQKTNIEQIQSDFQNFLTNSVDSMNKQKAKTDMFINNSKKLFNNMTPKSKFSTTSNQIVNSTSIVSTRNEVIMKNILLGNSIEFSAKGMTNRQSGRFITVDRSLQTNLNDFDSKILGQYFILSVTHRITPSDGYTNNIIASKPYSLTDLKFNNDIT